MRTIFFFLCFWCTCMSAAPFTIMLDPAGDAAFAGRHIDDSFERGISLQCVERLKQYLEERHQDIVVVITRFPGETIEPLQNANFANRLNVDLYISFHFYYEEKLKPELFIYRYAVTPQILAFPSFLTFCPLDQAYRLNATATQSATTSAKKVLTSAPYQSLFDVRGIFSIPFKPLVGITSPAFALEIGLKKKDDWRNYINALAETVIASIRAQKP